MSPVRVSWVGKPWNRYKITPTVYLFHWGFQCHYKRQTNAGTSMDLHPASQSETKPNQLSCVSGNCEPLENPCIPLILHSPGTDHWDQMIRIIFQGRRLRCKVNTAGPTHFLHVSSALSEGFPNSDMYASDTFLQA